MRLLLIALASTLVGCTIPPRMESEQNSTVPAKDAPERKCDRPATDFPRAALSKLGSAPVRTTLRFELLATGQVGTVNVKTSSGQKILDDAAVKAIGKMKCAPLTTSTQTVWLETWYEFKVD